MLGRREGIISSRDLDLLTPLRRFCSTPLFELTKPAASKPAKNETGCNEGMVLDRGIPAAEPVVEPEIERFLRESLRRGPPIHLEGPTDVFLLWSDMAGLCEW
jgi:hypothetical protein